MRRLTLLALVLVTAVAAGRSVAQVHPPENVTLLKNLDRGEDYAGNWGYTAPGGTELAISGTHSGTTFINATDPVNAAEVAFIPGPVSTWREVATYGQYAYIVTEQPGAALQVVSLANPLAPVLVATLNPPAFYYSTAHEIKADPSTGLLYICGTSPGTGQPDRGMVIVDAAANPTNPPLRGSWTTNYVHDISIQHGKAYAASIYDGIVYVLNVANPPAAPPWSPPIITQWTYPGASTHNTWPSADDHYLVTTDEVTGFTLKMWDISGLPGAPTQTDDFVSPTGAIVHNAYFRGNIVYMAHYKDGLRVVDVTDPNNIQPVGWYDTHPQDGTGYAGAWGCWCFAADPSIAYISDIQTGTYILRFQNTFGTLSGTVRNANTQAPLSGAQVVVEGANITSTTSASGTYSVPVPPGTYTVDCTEFGYAPGQSQVTISTGQISTLNFNLAPLATGGLSGIVKTPNQTPIAGATVTIQNTPLSTTTDANGLYSFASVPGASYNVTAGKFGFQTVTHTVAVTAGQQNNHDFTLQPSFFAADMETSPGTWTVSGNATTGQWVRVDPVGSGGGVVQPEDDHTPDPGVMCWITGQGVPGGGIGDNDVDNGNTILTTHVMDLSTLNDPVLDYFRWFVNDANGQIDDPWVVEVSSNGGTTWVTIENTLTAAAFWKEITVRLGDYLTLPVSQFRVRFTARDLNPGSIVEAGVDDFQIFDQGATTGVDQPGSAPGLVTVLHGNFPNPFNPQTAIRYDLAAGGPVKLRIFDTGGRLVRVLYDGRQTAGAQSVVWDGRNDSSAPVASGVYFYRLEAPGFEASERMVLTK
jgi:choice-of-anchor B domain-containing protein